MTAQTNPNRVPAGVTTGGQYAHGTKAEADVALGGNAWQAREDETETAAQAAIRALGVEDDDGLGAIEHLGWALGDTVTYEDGIAALVRAANPNANPEQVAASVNEQYGLEPEHGESAVVTLGWAMGDQVTYEGALETLVAHAKDAKLEPYRFNKDYNDHEQVRPYFEAYTKVYEELTAAGKYPYNDSFKGRIPGIEGPDEDNAIYMLQRMRDRDALAVKRSEFEQSGGMAVTADDMSEGEVRRGTVVSTGFYSGGSGWAQYEQARLVKHRGRLVVLEKGKRVNGRSLDGDVLFRPAGR